MNKRIFLTLLFVITATALFFSCDTQVDPGAGAGNVEKPKPPALYKFSVDLANDGTGTGSIDKLFSTKKGQYKKNTKIKVKANNDWKNDFVGWYDASSDGTLQSETNPYEFDLSSDISLFAKFRLKTYSLKTGITTDSVGKGAIDRAVSTLDGIYPIETGIKVKIEANQGHYFTGWYDAPVGGRLVSTNALYESKLYSNISLYASFGRKHSFITGKETTGNGKGSEISDKTAGEYIPGTEITIEARAERGSKFLGWYDKSTGGVLISETAKYTLTLDRDISLFAKYTLLHNFKFGKASDSTGNGEVSSSILAGTYISGSEITLNATPGSHSVFVGWFDAASGGNPVSINSSYSFTLDKDIELYSKFTLNKYNFLAGKTTDGNSKGNVTSSVVNGDYDAYKNIVLDATADRDSFFAGWYDAPSGGKLVSKDKKYTLSLLGDTKLYAKFLLKYTFNVDRTVEGTGIGTVTATRGNGSYDGGTWIKVTATKSSGSYFMGWYDSPTGGKLISRREVYSFTLEQNTALYAKIVKLFDNIVCSWTKNSSGAGTLKIDGEHDTSTKVTRYKTYYEGREVVLEAIPENGSKFIGWFKEYNGITPVSLENPYKFKVTEKFNIYAKFNKVFTYEVGIATDGKGSGTFTTTLPAGIYEKGTMITASATPERGSFFAGWYDAPVGGKLVSKKYRYDITLGEKSVVYARFEPFLVIDFPDPNLRESVRYYAGLSSGHTITTSDVYHVRQLYIHDGTKISDISGIEYLVSLEKLNLSNSNISDISKIKNLTKLTSVDFSVNNIVDISSLQNLTNLTELKLSANKIVDISSLAKLTKLKSLNISSNKITGNLNSLANLKSLTTLNLIGNGISSLSGLEGATSLTTLQLSSNNISDISALKGLVNLTSLDLSKNTVANLNPLGSLAKLKEIDLSNNGLSDISALKSLSSTVLTLYLNDNNIIDISALSSLYSLIVIGLNNNKIVDLGPLRYLTKINFLYLNSNPLLDINPLLQNNGIGTGDIIYLINTPQVPNAQKDTLSGKIQYLHRY